jgi:hypothetical protein
MFTFKTTLDITLRGISILMIGTIPALPYLAAIEKHVYGRLTMTTQIAKVAAPSVSIAIWYVLIGKDVDPILVGVQGLVSLLLM